MKDARTALAQAMRMERLGDTRFTWDTLDTSAKEEWCRRADHVMRLLSADAFKITESGGFTKASRDPPPHKTIYSVIGHNPSTERLVRKSDADDWLLMVRERKSGDEKAILKMQIESTDIDMGRVLSGDPASPKLPAITTRLAVANLIRKLHAEDV